MGAGGGTRVFLSVVGQNDNLGDSVLRRGLVRACRAQGAEIHVLVGANDDSYLSAVGLDGTEILHRRQDRWERALVRRVLTRRTVIAFNAGEVQVADDRAHLGWRARSWLTAAKLRGGAGIHVGVGIRAPGAGAPASLLSLLDACAVVAWRDADSRQAMGRGMIAPDLAFGERAPSGFAPTAPGGPSGQRRSLVVSMRGDRQQPSDVWLTSVRAYADLHGLETIAFSQVKRDNEHTERLAELLGAEAAPMVWTDESHAGRELVARELYSGAHAVVSDRLHALVIGATEGALPFGFCDRPAFKIGRTFEAIGVTGVDFSAHDSTPAEVATRMRAVDEGAAAVSACVAAAADRVDVLRRQIAGVIS